MKGIKDSQVEVKRLSPNDGFHYYYGYYDNPAFSEGDGKHLCNRVKFWDRLPTKEHNLFFEFYIVFLFYVSNPISNIILEPFHFKIFITFFI